MNFEWRFERNATVHHREGTTFLLELLEEFPQVNRAKLRLKIQHNRLRDKTYGSKSDFQQSQSTRNVTAGSDVLGFREEFLLLQLKCDLLVGYQDHAYSLRNARYCEDTAQRLQRFEETFHRRFAVLALSTSFAILVDQNRIGFLQVGESHL
jgi:hypothetical protein